jgi:hypothetical protein
MVVYSRLYFCTITPLTAIPKYAHVVTIRCGKVVLALN